MSAAGSWTFEVDADGLAWLQFDVPGSAVNVLSAAAMRELDARLNDIAGRRPRGLVIRSGKPSGFIAGADIKEFTAIRTPEEGYELVRTAQAVLDKLEGLPFPSVAALHGFALGGGLELALACRYRIGAEDGKLSLGLPEVQLGIHPGFGGTVRSVRLIGVRPAMELMLRGKPVGAQRALELGLIDALAPAAELAERARSWLRDPPARRRAPFAERLLSLSMMRPFVATRLESTLRQKVRREHYPAPYAVVDLWRRHGARGADSYVAEARSIGKLFCSPTSRNLVRVFLLQERLKGLGGKFKLDVRRVHVVGAGVMGGDIAAWAALRGMTVSLQDRSAALIEPALDRAKALMAKRLQPAAAAEAFARLRMDVSGEGVADADVLIEAIVENVEAKQSLYRELEPKLKPDAIFATNTSSIMLEVLCAKLIDPTRLVGIHFFNPVAQMQLVEVVRGASTSADVAMRALGFTRKLDKLPLPCKSAPGFLVNRILTPYLNEAMFALEEAIPAAVIDEAGKQFGMPMGPIELADVVGLDVCLSVGRVLASAFGRRVPELLESLVAQRRLGRKSGEGFYTWRDGKPVRAAASKRAIPGDLEDRLILPMVNEAVACLNEGIIEDADLLDAGAIFATGFAPFLGGPLQYARNRGVAEVRQRLAALESRYGDRFRPNAGWASLST